MSKKTETLTLAAAMDVLAHEIQSDDGAANAAIAEAAQRLRELEWEIAILTGKIGRMAIKLTAARTAFRDARNAYENEKNISEERIEAWENDITDSP